MCCMEGKREKRNGLKLQCLLALIPFFGMCIVFFMGAFAVYKRRGWLRACLFQQVCLAELLALSVIPAVCTVLFFIPPDTAAKLALLLVLFYLCCAGAGVAAAFTGRAWLKKFTRDDLKKQLV